MIRPVEKPRLKKQRKEQEETPEQKLERLQLEILATKEILRRADATKRVDELRQKQIDYFDRQIAKMMKERQEYIDGDYDDLLVEEALEEERQKDKETKGKKVKETKEGTKKYERPTIDRKVFAKTFFGDGLRLIAHYRGKTHTIMYRLSTDDYINTGDSDIGEEGEVYESLSKAVQFLAKTTGREKHYPNAWKTYKAIVGEEKVSVDRLDNADEETLTKLK